MPTPTFGLGRTIISGSGAVSASGATDNLNTSTGYPNGQLPAVAAVTLWCNWTALTGSVAANTGIVELQTSPDGGTSWVSALRFTQINTSSGTIMVNFRTDGLGGNEAAVNTGVVSTQTAAVTSNVVLTKDQRWTWTLSTGASLTFSVFANVMPAGSRTQC